MNININQEAKRIINNGLFQAKDWQKMHRRIDIYRHLLQNSIVRYEEADMMDIAEEIADIMFIQQKGD